VIISRNIRHLFPTILFSDEIIILYINVIYNIQYIQHLVDLTIEVELWNYFVFFRTIANILYFWYVVVWIVSLTKSVIRAMIPLWRKKEDKVFVEASGRNIIRCSSERRIYQSRSNGWRGCDSNPLSLGLTPFSSFPRIPPLLRPNVFTAIHPLIAAQTS